MKKIISILLTLAMAISLCANVAFADDIQAGIGKESTTYNPANALIYMDENMTEGYQHTLQSFLGTGSNSKVLIAIKWPPEIRTTNKRLTTVDDKATISNEGDAYTLTSEVSNVTYKLPAKIDFSSKSKGSLLYGNEAVMLDYSANISIDSNIKRFHELDINEKYDKIHILVATPKQYTLQYTDATSTEAEYSSEGWTRSGAFWAVPKYANEAVSLPEGQFKTSAAGDEFFFKTDFLKSADADGSKGVLGRIIPLDAEITNETRQNYLAELVSYRADGGMSGTQLIDFGDYSTDALYGSAIFVYEYCLDVDDTKTLEKITLGSQYSKGRKGLAVLSVVGEKTGITPFYKDLLSEDTLEEKAAKIYMDPTNPSETTATYNKKNFLGSVAYTTNEYVAIQWPLKKTSPKSYGMTYNDGGIITVDDKGTADTKDDISIVESKLSGMTYELTRDATVGDGAKDAVLLCPRRADEYAVNGEDYRLSNIAEIPVNNAPYDKISILLAAAYQSAESDNLTIYANYTDGTKSIADDSTNSNTGDAGYIKGTVPMHMIKKWYDQSHTYIAEVKTMHFLDENDANFDTDMPASVAMNFEESTLEEVDVDMNSYDATAYLFEYTLKNLDTTKTVESITVEVSNELIGTGTYTNPIRGCAVLGVAGQQAVVGNPADVAENEVAIQAYTTQSGDVYAAVYEKGTKKLVAMEKTAAKPYLVTDIVVENEAIAADGQYDIKLFIWATDGTFAPIIGTTDVATN